MAVIKQIKRIKVNNKYLYILLLLLLLGKKNMKSTMLNESQ